MGVKTRPDSVWNFAGQRAKFHHLTTAPPCICGVGRDVSFLYDARHLGAEDAASAAAAGAAPPLSGNPAASNAVDASHVRIVAAREGSGGGGGGGGGGSTSVVSGSGVSQSVVPEEYHVVKSKGVLGLEYHEDRFTTQPIDHEAHLTQFPSLKPAGRAEVKQLKKVIPAEVSRSDGFRLVYSVSSRRAASCLRVS